MNIFFLHPHPVEAAKMQHDKHVVKMVLETTQILSTVHHRYGSEAPYKPTHANHPCVQWAGDTLPNYQWLVDHGLALSAEYTYRYGRVHACETHLERLRTAPRGLVGVGCSPPPQCVPEQFKQADTVQAYREYYLAEKVKQSRWTYREVPHFIEEVIMAKAEKKIATATETTTPDAKTPKAPAKSIGPKGVDLNAKITVLSTGNPKRPNTKAYATFELYKNGQTVAENLAAGGFTAALIYDTAHGFIKIDGYEPKLVPVKPPKEAKALKEPKAKTEAKAKAAPAAGTTDELE